MTIYLTTDAKCSTRTGNYFCGVWCGERPSIDSDGNWSYDNPDDACLCRWYLPESRLAALGFPAPGNMRIVDIGPVVNLEDVPEIAFPRYLLASEPPEDQYKLMRMVDHWAANQAVADTDLKPHGLAWLALDEQARLDYCENYFGAVQHSAQNAKGID